MNTTRPTANLWCMALACLGTSAAVQVPENLAMTESLLIRSVRADRTSAPVHARFALSVDLEATYDNPFDSRQVRLDAAVTSPTGAQWPAPGFLYQPFTRTLNDGVEEVEPAGPPEWQIRLSFPEPGRYSVVVSADPMIVEATSADGPGMVRRHPTNHRYFVTDRGETCFLIGANVCWRLGQRTYDYDLWLPKYAENGCNFFRVWLAPHWVPFAMNVPELGFDRIDLGNAWRLDYVLDLAERLDLRMMACIDSFNFLRTEERRYGLWEDSPYIRTNGGPLDHPCEYFTNEAMLNAYRDRLRYLVARYGYSPALFAWEFWNEVDSETVTQWHEDMAHRLRAMDPWDHLIGTSHGGPVGDPRVDALPEMDFVQTHHYGAKDVAHDLGDDRVVKRAAADRPHFHGEYGISHSPATTNEKDPTGIHIHNGLYASVGQLQAGTPMT